MDNAEIQWQGYRVERAGNLKAMIRKVGRMIAECEAGEPSFVEISIYNPTQQTTLFNTTDLAGRGSVRTEHQVFDVPDEDKQLFIQTSLKVLRKLRKQYIKELSEL